MKERKKRNYWNKNNCMLESIKYTTRSSFKYNSGGAYVSARKNGWLDEICNHMILNGNIYNRCIYSYEFPDNYVYVGLTYNIEKRKSWRKLNNKDAVTKHINETGLSPKFIQLTDYINVNLASKLENYYLKKYLNNNWNILNRIKTGNIGGNTIYWTFEKCKEEALKYNSKNEFRFKSGSAYNSSIRNVWFNVICSHMIRPKHIYWTFEKCKEEALKYSSKKDFKNNSSVAYSTSVKNKWLNDICKHMNKLPYNTIYWTFEKCKEEALKYNSKNEFAKKSCGTYNRALKNGWLNEICLHMIEIKKPKNYWTFEKCKEEALKYKTRFEFQKCCGSAYEISLKNKWLSDICKHMINGRLKEKT